MLKISLLFHSLSSVVMKPISLVVNSWSSVQDVTGLNPSITLFVY